MRAQATVGQFVGITLPSTWVGQRNLHSHQPPLVRVRMEGPQVGNTGLRSSPSGGSSGPQTTCAWVLAAVLLAASFCWLCLARYCLPLPLSPSK